MELNQHGHVNQKHLLRASESEPTHDSHTHNQPVMHRRVSDPTPNDSVVAAVVNTHQEEDQQQQTSLHSHHHRRKSSITDSHHGTSNSPAR